MRKIFSRTFAYLALSLLSTFIYSYTCRDQSAMAAERISIWFGKFNRSISVSALESFARDGIVDPTLAPFLRRVSPETQAEIRRALTATKEVSPSEFSQLLHTPMGQQMLERTGQIIQTRARQNGAVAIRGALVLGSTHPDGLSMITFLRAFSTQELRLDLRRIVAQYQRTSNTITAVNDFLELVKVISEKDAELSPINFDPLPSLREKGSYSVLSQTIVLQDQEGDRSFPVDLYLPEVSQSDLPVIVVSHGLGSSRGLFRDYAEHLASHGFFVVVPEHVGSNQAQQEAVRGWLANELFEVDEFVNRPKDISFLLDELAQINSSEYQGQLNLDQVGVIGHSFGGYTALVLGGATVDMDRVRRLCQLDASITAGFALLLTCRILELESSPAAIQQLTSGQLKDDRVAFVMALNPVSNLFGESGMGRIEIPMVIAGGLNDFSTPILREQAEPFSWLTTSDKYLIVKENFSHGVESTTLLKNFFYTLEDSEEQIEVAINQLRTNVKALTVAYSQVYVAGNEDFRPFVTSAYLKEISRAPFSLYMTRSLPLGSVSKTLE